MVWPSGGIILYGFCKFEGDIIGRVPGKKIIKMTIFRIMVWPCFVLCFAVACVVCLGQVSGCMLFHVKRLWVRTVHHIQCQKPPQ